MRQFLRGTKKLTWYLWRASGAKGSVGTGLRFGFTAIFGDQSGRNQQSTRKRRCGGPKQVAQIDLHPSVDPTYARNTENQIAVGLPDRSAQLPISLAVRLRVALVTFVRAE
jgi:hypothetical protein